jgi:outer membrane biosynthesis protein TonB
MFEMFEQYGKQITAFLNEARALLNENKTEVQALRVENKELKEQVTRIEGAHLILMEWLADIDASEHEEELEEIEEAADTAVEAAAVAIESAAVAVEEVPKPSEETEVQEAVPPAVIEEEEPKGDEAPHLPETPVPDEPAVEPEPIPASKRKRFFI